MNWKSVLVFLAAALVAGVAAYYFNSAPVSKTGDTGTRPQIPQLGALAAEGQKTFSGRCAQCHGADAGGTDQGPPLIHKIYEPSHHGDAAFYSAALNGSRAHHWRFGDMPPVAGITMDEIDRVIAFVREVQVHNGIR
ncbi:MAG: cytochrome c [Rhizobiaceae bacterium]